MMTIATVWMVRMSRALLLVSSQCNKFLYIFIFNYFFHYKYKVSQMNRFYCSNQNKFLNENYIVSSKVDDKVCDCCDGSDGKKIYICMI